MCVSRARSLRPDWKILIIHHFAAGLKTCATLWFVKTLYLKVVIDTPAWYFCISKPYCCGDVRPPRCSTHGHARLSSRWKIFRINESGWVSAGGVHAASSHSTPSLMALPLWNANKMCAVADSSDKGGDIGYADLGVVFIERYNRMTLHKALLQQATVTAWVY